ncbi:SMC-Scp complex subunit ScpB [Kordiimonas lacus]|uniref:Condensin subunit ScpB n=1 Tax=Kordiimonas lacus TaxID=637679 RepID=A0A1G6VQL0_9PROT|nr:SMC-Scp complex subunit ScpB [Kordiimonas lacus]SDD55868.1 condensin subunit ScpB [Kordiimonas lacus]
MQETETKQVATDPEVIVQHRRMVEAVLFASENPLSVDDIAERLPDGVDVEAHIEGLTETYATSGVNLVRLAGKFLFRTAEDLSFLLRREVDEPRKLSRAAVETMAIIAYHQPVTRAEIEEIRGVSISKGTLDVLMEAGWVRMMGRKRTPGRPVTYGTTEDFLVHFGIETIKDLPGVQELKAAGLLDSVDMALEKMGGMPDPSKSLEEAEGQIDLEEAIAAKERATLAGADASGMPEDGDTDAGDADGMDDGDANMDADTENNMA